jgi:hypothetical protein
MTAKGLGLSKKTPSEGAEHGESGNYDEKKSANEARIENKKREDYYLTRAVEWNKSSRSGVMIGEQGLKRGIDPTISGCCR